jgi:hypothetical protein
VPEGWPYFGDEARAFARVGRGRAGFLDQLKTGLRHSEAKIWVAREVAGRWGPETVYEPAGDPHEYEPLSPGFWNAILNDPKVAIDDAAHAITAGGYRYMPIRISPLRETAEHHAAPAPPPEAAAAQQTTPRSRRGGPPTKFDWHEFYREIIIIADFDGLPERDELTRHMKDFVAGWSEVPGDSTLREKMADIYARQARERQTRQR